jgi:hypothetical protein
MSNFYWQLQEYKDFMRQQQQSGDTTQSYIPGARPDSGVVVNMAQWQNQGFPSAEAADLVTTIASAATTPAAQYGCLAALVHSLANPMAKKPHVYWPVLVTHAAAAPDQTAEHTLTPEPNKKPRTGIHHKHYMFSLWAQDCRVNAFNLVVVASRCVCVWIFMFCAFVDKISRESIYSKTLLKKKS